MTTLSTPQPEPTPALNRLRPVHEIRIGRIQAAIWENLTEHNTVRHKVTVQRLYRDPHNEKQWRSSDSFGKDDLPLVERVMHLAFDWIFEQSTAGLGRRNAAEPAVVHSEER
jgi:hypothetical protein